MNTKDSARLTQYHYLVDKHGEEKGLKKINKKLEKNKMDYNGIGFSNKNIDKLTKGQKYIASQAGNPNKIEAADFKALRRKK